MRSNFLNIDYSEKHKKPYLMKTLKLFLFFSPTLFFFRLTIAQNIGINGSGATAHPSALLDVDDVSGGNNKGLLIPRIPLTAINSAAPVTSPATSLLVYNTASASTGTNAVSPGYYYWDGTKWVRFAFNASGSSSFAWDLIGNNGTNPTVNFLGTTDAQDLVFRTNNIETMRMRNNGRLNIGFNDNVLFDFGHQLNVKNHMALKRWGQAPNYVQTRYNGTESSLSPVLSGEHVGAITFEASDGGANRPTVANIFAYAAENITSTAAGGHLTFNTTPTGTLIATEKMRIEANGNVGIGTTNPSAQLQIVATSGIPNLRLINSGTNLPYISFQNGSIIQEISSGAIRLRASVGKSLYFESGTPGGAYMEMDGNGNFGIWPGLTTITQLGKFHVSGDKDSMKDSVFVVKESGYVGIGTTTPANKLEITHGTAGNSGLRLTNLPNQSFLSTNSNGDVVPLTITTTTSNGLFWGLIGNAGTNSATNFMGTIDAQDLVFKTNNVERFRILQSTTPTIRANASNLLITKTGAGTNIIGFNNSNAGIVLGDNNTYGGSTTNVIIGNSNNTGGGGPINTIMLGSNFTTGGGGPSSSIFIGNNIATGGGGPLNSIFIGNGINTGGAINSVVIGNTSMTSIGGQVGWSTLSDGRFKKEIKDYTLGLEFINKLKPKSYKYNNNTNEIIYNGLIAQDVEQTLKELGAEFSGLCKPNTESENYSIRYGDFVIPLINAVKDQQQQIEALNKKNDLLLKRIEMLEKK